MSAQSPSVGCTPSPRVLVPIFVAGNSALVHALVGYNVADSGMSERDRQVVLERAQMRWDALLSAAGYVE